MKRPRIRIEADQVVGNHARVFHVGDDGAETELRRCVTGVHLDIQVGDANRATVELVLVGADAVAQVDDVLLKVLPPERIPDVIARLQEQLEEHERQ